MQLLDGFRLFLDAESVVEFVEETAKRDAEGQLDQLCLAEILFQPGEERVGDAAWPLPGANRVFDDKLVPLVEFRVVAVIEDAFDAGGETPSTTRNGVWCATQ